MSRGARSVTIRVPASTSNLGSGFDTLGVALAIHNRVTLRRLEKTGPLPGTRAVSRSRVGLITKLPMVQEAASAFFDRTRHEAFPVEVAVRGDVPVARGLGSSVTLRLGVVAGLNELAKAKLTRQDLLDIVTALEQHPDNAAPAIFGGFTVAGMINGTVRCLRAAISAQLRFVALIPKFEISTETARRLVPTQFSKADLVHSLNRVALVTGALATGQYELVRGLFDDRVHQPYRQKLIPQLSEVIAEGEKAGALGGWLSGSGSTIICLAKRAVAARVGRAMQRVLSASQVKLLEVDNRGFGVERAAVQ